MIISVKCKHCKRKLSFPFNSEVELVEAYYSLTKIYYEHLNRRHKDFFTVLEGTEINLNAE